MPFLSPNQQCQSTEGKKSSYVTVAGKGREGDVVSRQHCKGCNCKRSGCLKNYCECYEVNFRLSFISFSTSVAVNVKLPVHLWTFSQSVVDGVMLVFVGHPEPYARHLTSVEVRATTGCRPLSHLLTDKTFASLRSHCPQFTTGGSLLCCCSWLEATVRKT